MNRIAQFRQNGVRWLYGLLGLNVVVSIGASRMADGPTLVIGIMAVVFGVCGVTALRFSATSATARVVFAIVAQGQVAVLVGAFAGHAWQVDAHMHFFATMGILILLVDYRAILAGAVVVALHHIILNFALPGLVYPGGTDLGRTVMHAVILMLATLALASASRTLAAITDEAQAGAQANEAMIDQLNTSLGHVVQAGVQGDFAARITTRFEDARLQRIADGTNDLVISVERGISQTCAVMANVAMGQLDSRVQGDFAGAFGDLQRNVNTTIGTLRDVVSEIGLVSAEISNETVGISDGSEGLSDQAARQAASVEETSAAMQELTESVGLNVDAAQQMSQVATTTSQQVQLGQATADDATGAMRKMSDSSDRIRDIVNMMDEIAFQTNLLALNASVEAARAGDAGQGFGVVAQEVRALALRSADSARDIRALIEESSANVREGVALVDRLGTTLQDMVGSVSDVAVMAKQIAATSADQSGSIMEMSGAVKGIDKITQHMAGTAEAYFQKSRRLKEEVGRLGSVMGHFNQPPSQDHADQDQPNHAQRARSAA
jgi:methyl-accepting chemotaxis protein